MVTHLLGCPGQLSAFSNSSIAPLVFFSFLTRASTAFSAHFSSSSPCFQPNSFLTAGLVNENKLFIDEIVDDERPESNSSTSITREQKLNKPHGTYTRGKYSKTRDLSHGISVQQTTASTTISSYIIYLLLLLLFGGREKGKRASLIRIQRWTVAGCSDGYVPKLTVATL